jgi:hypothetical protein
MSKNLYLHLYHGRPHPDLQLQDWGESGPSIGPFEVMQSTYAANVRLFSNDYAKEAWLNYVGDLVYFRGVYYGDFSIETEPGDSATPSIPLDEVTDADCMPPSNPRKVPAVDCWPEAPVGFNLLDAEEQSELARLARQWAEIEAGTQPDKAALLDEIARSMVAALIPE